MFKQKKALIFLAGILLFLAAFLLTGRVRAGYSAPAGDAASISMDISYGYDNTARGGRYLPIHIQFKSTKEAFAGELHIKSRESNGEIYEYIYPLEIEGESRESYYIPLGIGAKYILIYLSDPQGNTVLSRKIELGTRGDGADLMIGILSDTPEKLKYFDKAPINYGVIFSKTVNLDAGSFPQDAIGLSQLDMIIISNYRIRNLNEAQSRALMEWVKDGGIMVLGTGMRVNDTLGRYAPELLDDMYEDPRQMEINLNKDFGIEEPGETLLFLDCVDISLHGGNALIRSDMATLLSAVHKERGIIAVAAFDFADLKEESFDEGAFVNAIVYKVMGSQRIDDISSGIYGLENDVYWEMQPFINSGTANRIPNLSMYLFMILIYIMIVGPGVFIFLKQRGRTLLYRKSILLSAALFGIIIYAYGGKTRFRGSFIHYLTIMDTDEDNILEKTYINIRNPYKQPYEVNISPEYSVYPITEYLQGSNEEEFDETSETGMSLSYLKDTTRVGIASAGAFHSSLLSLESSDENRDHIGFSGEISLFGGELRGYIRNNFHHPVEDAAVIMHGKLILLGDFDTGETKDLSGLEVYNIPLNHHYMVSGFINHEKSRESELFSGEFYQKVTDKTNIMSFYMHMTSSAYTADAKVIGFAGEESFKAVLPGKNMENSGVSLLSSTLPTDNRREDRVYRSALSRMPDLLSGFFVSNSNSMYAMEPLVLEYQLGDDIDVEELDFEFVSDQLKADPALEGLEEFEGKLSFYNYSTGKFEEKEFKKYSKEELKNYLTPPNSIRVKYVYKSSDNMYAEVVLPMLRVIGRER